MHGIKAWSLRFRAIIAVMATLLVVSGGIQSGILSAHPADAKTLKFGLITKMGTDPWFVSEGRGAASEARKLGVTLIRQDVALDSNQALNAFGTILGEGVDGILTVPPSGAIGPSLVSKASAAHVPLMSIDDFIYDSHHRQVPWVGAPWAQIGQIAGREEARLYKSLGWNKDANVGVAAVVLPTLSVCNQRTDNTEAAFLKALPSFNKGDIFHITYDGTLNGALNVMPAAITAHANITKWLIWSCNDDGVIGAWRAMHNKGIDASHVIGVAEGGLLFCGEWNAGKPSGLREMVFSNPANEGAKAVDLLYNHVIHHAALPLQTALSPTILTQQTYRKVTTCQ